jgi:hypothetical protein
VAYGIEGALESERKRKRLLTGPSRSTVVELNRGKGAGHAKKKT